MNERGTDEHGTAGAARYSPKAFLRRLVEQTRDAPVAYTLDGEAQIVVMSYATFQAMKERIEELEQLLPLKQQQARGHKPLDRLNGGGFIPLSALGDTLAQQQQETEDQQD